MPSPGGETLDPRAELEKVEAALAGQEALRGVLPPEQFDLVIAGLEKKKAQILTQLALMGGVAFGAGAATAVGLGSAAASGGSVAVAGNLTLVQGAPPVGPKEGKVLQGYLGHLLQEVGYLDLTGIDPDAAQDRGARLGLESVYTALLTRSSDDGDGTMASAEPMVRLRQLSALELLDRHPRLVLLGDPGSGKSTFVHFVALCLAGEILGRSELNLDLLRSPLPADEPWRQKEQPPQPWSHGPLCPVRVVLRELAAGGLPPAGQDAAAGDLWRFLEKKVARTGLAEAYPILRRELLEGRGLLMLDGLDEVPEAELRRKQVRQVIEDLAGTLRACGSRVLLTSRTYAYEDPEWRVPGFVEAVLAPFSRGQIDRFITLWYAQKVAHGRLQPADAQGRAQLLRRGIFGSERILGLAERPLLLTLLAGLHAARGGSLPERRGELYAEAVELLLNTWELRRVHYDADGKPVLAPASLAEWLRVDRHEVRQVLDEAAFGAHATQAGEPGRLETADIQEKDLVAPLLHLSRNPKADAVELVAYLRDRAGLLVERGERLKAGTRVYTFPHRTFQEFLAACHLTLRSFPKGVARLGREDPDRWREVVLLAAAKAARGSVSSVWALADSLCCHNLESEDASAADKWGALLAGQALAESADLEQIDPEDQLKLERVREWLLHLMRVESFPARERAAAGKALAVLGDPRFDPDLWLLPREPDVGFLRVSAGKFWMGSDPEFDLAARHDEQPQHEVDLETFWLARYPVTVGQFKVFVQETGYQMPNCYWSQAPSNHPVTLVGWRDALAYCRWLDAMLREALGKAATRPGSSQELWSAIAAGRLQVTLPSEAEWEKAARGDGKGIYSWGSDFDQNRVNCHETGLRETSAVGCFPGGRNPLGHEELNGNIWEWTRSLWGWGFESPEHLYPYTPGEVRESLEWQGDVLRVLRGGAFLTLSRFVRCACRHRRPSGYSNDSIGFRVVLSPLSSGL